MARFILLLLVLLPPDFLVLADDAIIDIEPLHVVAKNETLAQLIAGHPKVKMNAMINQFYNRDHQCHQYHYQRGVGAGYTNSTPCLEISLKRKISDFIQPVQA